MASETYQNQKCTLEHSKKAIDRAARAIRHGCIGDVRNDAIAKIQNFREIHLYPLMLMKNHLVRTSNKVSKKTLVARRLKRLPTIINKLERATLDGNAQNAIKLTRMQDIGGCRAIVKDLRELRLLHNRLMQSKSVHKIIDVDDYLTPKDSGYGGIHLVYSCFHGEAEGHEWKKTKIEIQLRTELQHAWATSLEIIDTLEGFDLKTSREGNEKWRRFFRIAGVLVAHYEGACIIDEKLLMVSQIELAELNTELNVTTKLSDYAVAMNVVNPKHFPRRTTNLQGMFLVAITDSGGTEKKILRAAVTHYDSKSSHEALNDLRKSEANEEILISVLLSSPNVRTLKKAYPNYFGSTSQFTTFIHNQIKQGIGSSKEYINELSEEVSS